MIDRKLIQYLTLVIAMVEFGIIILAVPGVARAEESDVQLRILMLPFEIKAESSLAYLSTQIPEVMRTHLSRSGATIIMAGEIGLSTTALDTIAQRLARDNSATHIIGGTLSLIGNSFTIEVEVASVEDIFQPTRIKAAGTKLENLLGVLKNLSDDIGQMLFQQRIIADIQIKGNQRIEADAILRLLQCKVGAVYQPRLVSNDLHTIYNMGYFDDLKVDVQSGPKGKIITYYVKEKPTIRLIKFKGNQHFGDDKLKENLTISTGSVLNIFKIRNNIDLIVKLYKEDNYHQIKVDYHILPLENNQADLEFILSEGEKLYITDIKFEGNQAFTENQLEKEMSTSVKGFFYWLSSSGDLDRTVLDQDIARLNAFYLNQGYIHARIGEPQVDILSDQIHVTIKIDEGPQFKVGKIDIDGELILPKDALLQKVKIGQERFFNREKLQQDVITLTDIYAEKGYANADVVPQIDENDKALTVDVTYRIQKKQLVYFEDIIISGNTTTRDKVIRRELSVFEQDLFNGKELKRSIRNLYRLNYFEDIKVKTLKGSADDKMVLRLDVKEKPTGTFSFGAGYSSAENFFLVGAISMRNFLGRGQTLEFNGQLGGATTRFTLSFTEPWLFDTHLSATANVYSQQKEYAEYNVESIGAGLRFGYPIYDYTRIYWGYSYDISKVSDVTDEAPDTIWELEGTTATSSVIIGMGYDSRDRTFNATEGSKHSLSMEYAGLGGDIGFTKTILDTGWYIPLFKGFVGFVHGKAGSVYKNSDDKLLPDYEKFYLGGINSLRGYESTGVHLTKINSKGEESEVGGNLMAQINLELLIPLYQKLGLMGVVFYDTGNVYEDQIDLGDLRSSWGYGIRWLSPIAPIRLEYGNVIDPREGEESGRLEFSLGGAF